MRKAHPTASRTLRLKEYTNRASDWNASVPSSPLSSIDEPDLRDAGEQHQGANLMQQCPELRVVDVERIVGGVLNQARNHLSGLHGNVPGGKCHVADAEAEHAADGQYPERPEARRGDGSDDFDAAWYATPPRV